MEINITLIGQMITFVLFVWFTLKFVWPPIMKALSDRQRKLAEGLAAADQAQQSLVQANLEAEQCVQDAKRQAMTIIEQAQQKAQRLHEDAQFEGRHLIERMQASAKQDIDRQRRVAEQELKNEVANLAVRCAEKIIHQHLSLHGQEALMQQLVHEIDQHESL